MDFFYHRSGDSTCARTPHAPRNNDSFLNLTIPKKRLSQNRIRDSLFFIFRGKYVLLFLRASVKIILKVEEIGYEKKG